MIRRDKCRSESEKPVCEQHGTTQCKVCSRWLRGGLAVHTCRPTTVHSWDRNFSFVSPDEGKHNHTTVIYEQDRTCVCACARTHYTYCSQYLMTHQLEDETEIV